jgi:hypothetical protein
MGDDRPVPEWLLERLARNELPAAEASRLRARLEARGEGGRLQAIERSDREILDAHPPAVVAAEVRRRAGMHRRGGLTWRSTLFSGLALGAAGLAVVFAMGRSPRMAPGVLDPAMATGPETTTAKGLKPRLALYRKQAKRADRLPDGAVYRRGDLLQLAYVAPGQAYGMIASIDARGSVTLHLPGMGGSAPKLEAGKEVALPSAFELDGTPGFERFVFVTSATPFDTAQVVAALQRNGRPLPEGLSLTELTLHKDKP